MKKRVAVLGATGSIGRNTLDVLRNEKDRFEPVLFSAHKNINALLELKKEFPAAIIAQGDELPDAIAAAGADITVNGIAGAAGLEPSAAAIKAGSDLALANKETLVIAGGLILDMARENKVNIIPVDSEHSAVFKLIGAHGKENVSEIILTASGGPFRNYSMEDMARVTPKDALAHPTWSMGAKITVDSASLANKGLEVIEAANLFGFPLGKIRVVIHPQSIVHSMVRLKDGAVYAQMSKPDMRLPIFEALTWPETASSSCVSYGELFFDSLSLSFEKCDTEKFPMLALAYKALDGGPHLSIAYNAANEAAVEAFFSLEISFLEIKSVVSYVIEEFSSRSEKLSSIPGILAVDMEARKMARDFIGSKRC